MKLSRERVGHPLKSGKTIPASFWKGLLEQFLPSKMPSSADARNVAILLLTPDEAPAAAFVAGVLRPLIGADLLHLRDIPRIATCMASIGGAGTFDGIVLSGILVAYLA